MDSSEAEVELGDLLTRGFESPLELGDLLTGSSEPQLEPGDAWTTAGPEQPPGPWATMAATTLPLVAATPLLPPAGARRGHHLLPCPPPGERREGGLLTAVRAAGGASPYSWKKVPAGRGWPVSAAACSLESSRKQREREEWRAAAAALVGRLVEE